MARNTKEQIFKVIKEYNGALNCNMVADDLNLSVGTVRKHFKALCDEGRCEQRWGGHHLLYFIKSLA